MRRPRLTIELVPSTCWYTNVRSNVSRAQWERCKKFVQERSGDRCEVCGGAGRRWAVECHEVWEYDEDTLTQRLLGLIALCPTCHQVKHFGRTSEVGGQRAVAKMITHLATVNDWTPDQAGAYIKLAFRIWKLRSEFEWELDISYLETLGIPTRVGDRN